MNAAQIAHHLKDCQDFIGVFSLNCLPTSQHGRVTKTTKFIVNTHTDNLPGEHWLSVCGNHLFDPLGLYYPVALIKFMYSHFTELTFNREMYQAPRTDLCGLFCIFTLLFPNYREILTPRRFLCNELILFHCGIISTDIYF
jgi:hypothetical protein